MISTRSYALRTMDEAMVLAMANKFQKWRIGRLLKKLNAEQRIIYDNILSYRVEVTDYGYSEAPLMPSYKVYAYTKSAMYRLYDDVVLSYYPIKTYSGKPSDTHDSETNQWYSAGERVEWTNKLYKLIRLYNRIISTGTARIAELEELNAFKEKLKEL